MDNQAKVESKKVDLSHLPLQRIAVTAPISADLLRRSFTENIEFVVDYDNSRFKGKVFLTYLSNLDIKVRLHLPTPELALELFKEYLHLPAICNLAEMNTIALNVLLAYRGKENFLSFDPTEFIEQNREILERWNRRICQLPVFALYCRGGELRQRALDFPEDTDDLMTGINYVKLISHPDFAFLIDGIKDEEKTYNVKLFEKFFFKGANLFYFFAVPNNPLFMAVMMSPAALKQAIQMGNTELAVMNKYLEENYNVPSV